MRDDELVRLVLGSARAAIAVGAPSARSLRTLIFGAADPNDRRFGRGEFEGVCFTPLSTTAHQRGGARERVLDVAARHPDRLRIELHALATRIVFDEQNRAVGVEYLAGAHLYRADPAASATGKRRRRRGGSPRGAKSSSPAALSIRRSY